MQDEKWIWYFLQFFFVTQNVLTSWSIDTSLLVGGYNGRRLHSFHMYKDIYNIDVFVGLFYVGGFILLKMIPIA
jgi:hypothetical protein